MSCIKSYILHELLKTQLFTNEEIWIYDEPHECAVTSEMVGGRMFYTSYIFVPSIDRWSIIDIQCTDEHGAQRMYELVVERYERLHK